MIHSARPSCEFSDLVIVGWPSGSIITYSKAMFVWLVCGAYWIINNT